MYAIQFRVGVMLAEELLNNPNASYETKCFIDVDQSKVGRYIYGVQVLSESEATIEYLSISPIQEIAKMEPKQLIILDVYENCAYDIQQELKIAYGDKLNLQVEIVSICDRK